MYKIVHSRREGGQNLVHVCSFWITANNKNRYTFLEIAIIWCSTSFSLVFFGKRKVLFVLTFWRKKKVLNDWFLTEIGRKSSISIKRLIADLSKVHIFWECMYCQSNNWWRFRKILGPSQNIWTLKFQIYPGTIVHRQPLRFRRWKSREIINLIWWKKSEPFFSWHELA